MKNILYIQPNWFGTGLSNQLFFIIYGIINAIKNENKILIIDKFRQEPLKESMCYISEIIDIKDLNNLLKTFNVEVMDRKDIKFSISKITYGADNNYFDITDCILKNFYSLNTTHGGYIPLQCYSNFENSIVISNKLHYDNVEKNISEHTDNSKIKLYPVNILVNLFYFFESVFPDKYQNNSIIYSENENIADLEKLLVFNPIVLVDQSASNKIIQNNNYHVFYLNKSNLVLYIPNVHLNAFTDELKYYLIKDINDNNILDYDNLINLCIMVKNAGPQFEDMLKQNYDLIDQWTILDTGSTDETLDIINRVLVGKKRGTLYQEPFINFKDSRNRLLDLAGQKCKYTLMLDDTYIIKGTLRDFLNIVRGDQFSDSFTLFIKSDDVEYGSNRILHSDRKLRYLYKIHEVIDPKNNINVVVPINVASIFDGRFDYMEKRTIDRKKLDLKLLQEEIDEDPENPRSYYYMAQTYNLLEEHELAFEYFIKRMNCEKEGFIQEKIDAIFEAARIANFKINKPWEECEALYNKAYELDNSRPDSLYFLGIHHFLENNKKVAYDYFKKAFEIGYPLHCQYSLKPTLSFHFLPRYLTQLCGIQQQEN